MDHCIFVNPVEIGHHYTYVLFICSAISSSEKCLPVSKTESYGLSRICFEMTYLDIDI
jgi:hypothetical protein